ncbi:MAG TPA: YceI family protein [Caulobacteraceae bacterium]|nr:YceI family protein [Caulobacteraceae bacterium]
MKSPLKFALNSTAAVAALIAAPTLVLAQGAPPMPNPDPAAVPAGVYKVEPNHTRIVWQVSHMGLSEWFGDFARPTGTATFDPKNPAADKVDLTIDVATVSTTNATLDGELKSADWLDAAKFPTITFKSTHVTQTGPGAADVTGDLTLHGVTKPVTLKVKFRAGGVNMMNKAYTVGFDATSQIKRSDFGVTKGVPMIGDDVQITISAPFEKQP